MFRRTLNPISRFLSRRLLICSVLVLLALSTGAVCQGGTRPTSVSVIDFGNSKVGTTTSERLREGFSLRGFMVLDADLSRAAAKGAGYSGSLNMTLSEARDLGSALSSDFYLVGDAQTLRRSSSSRPIFFESYASVFLISSRTGKLVFWDRLSADSESPQDCEQELLKMFGDASFIERLSNALRQAEVKEHKERIIPDLPVPLIEEAPDDEDAAAAQGLRYPRPYRRIRPDYPPSAAKAEAEATVDVLVDVGADGEVGNIEVVRWAGFGLDEATVATVRQMHFFPAMRDGVRIPMRVLLRYNFRKPAR